MKKILLTLSLIIGFTTVAICDDPPPFNPGAPQGIPIDGGIVFLAAAGGSYGLKKLKDSKSKKELV
jgi:hypothetical protein